jgi:hypothetical protein
MWVQALQRAENNLSASVLLPTGRLHLARVLGVHAQHANRHGPDRSLHWYATPAKRQRGFPSTFPPLDARPRGTGRNRQGRLGMLDAVGKPFVHVAGNERDQLGMVGAPRGDGDATCKIAGIAYTGSNPVPAK